MFLKSKEELKHEELVMLTASLAKIKEVGDDILKKIMPKLNLLLNKFIPGLIRDVSERIKLMETNKDMYFRSQNFTENKVKLPDIILLREGIDGLHLGLKDYNQKLSNFRGNTKKTIEEIINEKNAKKTTNEIDYVKTRIKQIKKEVNEKIKESMQDRDEMFCSNFIYGTEVKNIIRRSSQIRFLVNNKKKELNELSKEINNLKTQSKSKNSDITLRLNACKQVLSFIKDDLNSLNEALILIKKFIFPASDLLIKTSNQKPEEKEEKSMGRESEGMNEKKKQVVK